MFSQPRSRSTANSRNFFEYRLFATRSFLSCKVCLLLLSHFWGSLQSCDASRPPRVSSAYIARIQRPECKAEIQRLKQADSDVPVDLIVHDLTAVYFSVLTWWLSRRSRLTLANRFTLVQRLIIERGHRWVFALHPAPWVTRFKPSLRSTRLLSRPEQAAWAHWHTEQTRTRSRSITS
jgi:hypothetical protein